MTQLLCHIGSLPNWVMALTLSVTFSLPSNAGTIMEKKSTFGLKGQEVPDQILASIRGRFVEGRQVAFFGVEMRTNWIQSDNRSLNMQMNVNIDLSSGRHQPIINIYHSQDIGTATLGAFTPALVDVSDNGALNSVSGVVQNIQVAGDGNSIHNNVNWEVREQQLLPSSVGLSMTPATAGGHYVDLSGRHTQVVIGNQGIGYQIDIPDIGRVTQQLSSQNLKGGALLQSSQIHSHYNQVMNHIGLQVDLSPAQKNMEQLRMLNRSLEQLRGL